MYLRVSEVKAILVVRPAKSSLSVSCPRTIGAFQMLDCKQEVVAEWGRLRAFVD